MNTSIIREFEQNPLTFLSVVNGASHAIHLFSTEAGTQIDRHGHWNLGGKISHPYKSFPQDDLLQVHAGNSIYDDTGLLALPGTMSPDTILLEIPKADIVVVSKRFFEGARGKGINPLDLDRLFLIQALYSNSPNNSPRAKKVGAAHLTKAIRPLRPEYYLDHLLRQLPLTNFPTPTYENGAILAQHVPDPLVAGISLAAICMAVNLEKKKPSLYSSDPAYLAMLEGYCAGALEYRRPIPTVPCSIPSHLFDIFRRK